MMSPEVVTFLAGAGWHAAQARPLAGDASARRYLRIVMDTRRAVLMIAPVETQADRDSLAAFLRIGAFLRGAGFAAPAVLAEDVSAGYLLLEDFGDLSLSILLKDGNGAAAYDLAAKTACDLSDLALQDGIARPDVATQAAMVDLTYDQLAGGQALGRDMRSALQDALQRHAGGAPCLSLRDYHGDNLIWRPEKSGPARLGLLDFQDAVALPAGYDIASLVDDPRRVVPDDIRNAALRVLAERKGEPQASVALRVDTLSLVRNLRILGIFHRLAAHRKPAYRAYLPRTVALIERAVSHPALSHLHGPVAATLDAVRPWLRAEAS